MSARSAPTLIPRAKLLLEQGKVEAAETISPKLVNFLTRWYEHLTPPGTPLPEVFTRPEQRKLL